MAGLNLDGAASCQGAQGVGSGSRNGGRNPVAVATIGKGWTAAGEGSVALGGADEVAGNADANAGGTGTAAFTTGNSSRNSNDFGADRTWGAG